MFGHALHDKLCGGGGNDVISLGGGPDVGYGGDCGAVEPPTVTKSGWWRTLPVLWRHAGGLDAAPKTGPGVNDNDRLSGGKGDDVLFGGAGADRIVGGSGARLPVRRQRARPAGRRPGAQSHRRRGRKRFHQLRQRRA